MEIGGYIELEKNSGFIFHKDAIKLNCGRNALAYLIESAHIKRILMPKFMCDSCDLILKKYNVETRHYSIGHDFRPQDIILKDGEWLYLVNFYGQLSNSYIRSMKKRYDRIIVDNAQAYFQSPVNNVDTIYTCRKFFGVADGAMLYTASLLNRSLVHDESFERIHFLLGRFERTASEFYAEYVANNNMFNSQPVKYMSKLTENMLTGLDYKRIKNVRTENFTYLHEQLKDINKLNLEIPVGPFMYPLYINNGYIVRKKLQKDGIYIPTLWPAVFNLCAENEPEYKMARDILPLPVDQRYGRKEMDAMLEKLFAYGDCPLL